MSSRIIGGSIDVSRYDLQKELDWLNSITKLPEEYDEFGQGYWKNLSLFNASGNAEDSQYRETDRAFPTEYAEACPEIRRLLQENFSTAGLRMVRARSLIDGMVVPHRDFVELDPSKYYFRVFVPLETNEDAFHSDESGVFQMRAGEVWFLNAAINHAAINFGGKSRMFLCLDYIFTKPFSHDEIFNLSACLQAPRENFYIQRERLSTEKRRDIVFAATKLISRETFKDLLFAFSKYHFKYDVMVAECYDWLLEAAVQADDKVLVNKVNSLKRYLIEQRSIGERYVINNWDL